MLTKNFLEALKNRAEKEEHKINQIKNAIENAKIEKAEAEANAERLSKRFSILKEEIRHWELEEMMEQEIQEVNQKL